MLEKILKLIPKLSELFPVVDFFGGTMCKNISTWERSSFLNLQMTTQFQAYTIFSVPKIIPIITPDTRKPLFFPTGFSERLTFDFFSVKSHEGGTSFSLQITFFNAKISYKIKEVRFDQMKNSGRG